MPRASTSRQSAAAVSSSSPVREARTRRSAATSTSTSTRRAPSRRTNGHANDDDHARRSDSVDIDVDMPEGNPARADRNSVNDEAEEQEEQEQPAEEVLATSRDTFYITIYALVRLIPAGRVTTYGESGLSPPFDIGHSDVYCLFIPFSSVLPSGSRTIYRLTSAGHLAKLAGRPRNSRLVGQALKFLPRRMGIPPEELPPLPAGEAVAAPDALANGAYVPWHRVINSRGVISARGSVGYILAPYEMPRKRLKRRLT